ncbi:hypothetical protein C8A01DRAFT_41853 [Parachaetomium inaequale]|uniref:MYND-type domain-containing protein n=1 Tax=Parachaetomium inaequale TaxID=2588326 RepID=A0AAN6P4Q1_9PEZI|nr:hypothetical protein C8A01DRAFT_41853 [Parachaetomium inaequale]
MDWMGRTTSHNATDDPVDNFFRRMPPAIKDAPSLWTQNACFLIQNACQLLVTESMVRASADPDHKYLLEHVKRAPTEHLPAQYILQQLALLAFTQGVADDDDSHKARCLRHCRWMAQGRKDKTARFGPVSDTDAVPSVSKAVLPESSTFNLCAECGKDGATKQCAGCLVRTDNTTTLATSYCSKECQIKHWGSHRALCRRLQQISRAVSLFQDIFEQFLTLTSPDGYLTEKITEKNGMVVV